MSQEITKAKTKKHSLTKSALFSCILDLVVIITHIGIIVERLKPVSILDYDPATYKMRQILRLIFIIGSFLFLIYAFYLMATTEKEDELAKIHRYKAGYISKFISLFLFAIALYIIKDFSFAYKGDFLDNLSLPFIMLMTELFIENIIFIIFEKFQID